MKQISRIVLTGVLLLSIGLSGVASAQELMAEYEVAEARLQDTPSKWGFKGLYTLFSPDTAQKGKYGLGLYWDMTRFVIPGDPRYPQVMEVTLGGYYGITDRLEVGIAAPFRSLTIPDRESRVIGTRPDGSDARTRFDDDPAFDEINESGFSNVSLGVRYNAVRGANFMMTPYIQAFLPTASDPEAGIGADNTRIHFGMSAGTVVGEDRPVRLYSQVAYQFATDYDQDRRDFMETPPYVEPERRPRFDFFGSNPLYHEYGNTLFYSAGFALPLIMEEERDDSMAMDLFSEFLFYHSLEDDDHIPMYEDGDPLDVVQDGGMAHVGAKLGFDNGVALTAGWGSILFAEEPMYESPHWRAFAGLTYNPAEATTVTPYEPVTGELLPRERLERPDEDYGYEPIEVTPEEREGYFDCTQELLMVHFDFDKSTLTAEAMARLDAIGKYMRICTNAKLEVQGHTDWIGTENYNYGLGNRRARAAVYYLMYDQGIDPSRIVSPEKLANGVIAGESYGETQPLQSNETDAGRAVNRRAQFVKLTY